MIVTYCKLCEIIYLYDIDSSMVVELEALANLE